MKLIDGNDVLSNNGDLGERKYAVRTRGEIKHEMVRGIEIPWLHNGNIVS